MVISGRLIVRAFVQQGNTEFGGVLLYSELSILSMQEEDGKGELSTWVGVRTDVDLTAQLGDAGLDWRSVGTHFKPCMT